MPSGQAKSREYRLLCELYLVRHENVDDKTQLILHQLPLLAITFLFFFFFFGILGFFY